MPVAVMTLIPETPRTFGMEFPQIQLRIMEELYIQQLTGLRTDQVDIAVGPVPEHLPPGEFAVEKLMSVNMMIVVRVREGPLQLPIGALARAESALKPSVRHFLAHLHRAAHHLAAAAR